MTNLNTQRQVYKPSLADGTKRPQGARVMTIMDKIKKTAPTAPRITVYGKPGIGKSTLASQFPSPLFLLTENAELLDVDAIPPAVSFTEMWGNVNELLATPNLNYKTIVVDSISKLDSLVVQHILDNEQPNKSGQKAQTLVTACGGYGAGYAKAQSIHRAFKYKMDKFKERGISVVYLSHLAVAKHKSPDMEDYDIYSLVMNHDKSREIYIDDVDAVLFCKLKSFVTETENGKHIVKSTDQRIIMPSINDGHVSKNRYAMPDEIPMDFDSLAYYIPFYNTDKQECKS